MTFRPMSDLNARVGRLPTHGRIRLGQQVATNSGKTRPAALHTFRFTSPSRSAIEAIAELYGGDIAAWNNEWEVVSKTSEIPVVLPPDPLGDGTVYELWTSGGLKRRCDGVTAVCPTRVSPDEVVMNDVPCLCNEAQVRACSEKTRLSVILPDVPFGGVWRLDTGSYHASEKLPAMVAAIQAFAQRGFVKAFLGVTTVEKMEEGRKKKWVEPYLRMDASVTEALTGAAGLAGIAVAPPIVALPAPIEGREVEPDDDRQYDGQEDGCDLVRYRGPGSSPGRVGAARETAAVGGQGVGFPQAPDLDVYSVAEAKSRLLAVTNGDIDEARRAWDGFGFADYYEIPVAEFTAASLAYVAAKYHQQPSAAQEKAWLECDDGAIVDAEIVEDGEPFE